MTVRRGFTAVATAVGMGVGASSAAAAPPLTFSGSCTFPAVFAKTDNGAGFLGSAAINARATATGTCSGTANGQPVEAVPTSAELQMSGRTSCLATMPDIRGGGTLTIGGTPYPVGAQLVLRGGMFFTITVTGTSGSATGRTTADLIASGMNPNSGPACLFGRTTELQSEALTLRTGSTPLVLG